MIRLIVAGSRHFADEEAVETMLVAHVDFARGHAKRRRQVVVVHGGAKGADALADKVAKKHGWNVEVFPADWDKHGKVAGPIRNQEMVDAGARAALLFPLEDSKGTWDLYRRAIKASIDCYVYGDFKMPESER